MKSLIEKWLNPLKIMGGGMATKKIDVEVFVLMDCGFGKAGEVVTLSAADAETGVAHGVLDLNPAAIKAAKAK